MANDLLNIATKVNNAIRSDKFRRVALITVLAVHKERIFTKGIAEDGSQIGTYSKKYGELKKKLGRNPGYVNLRLTDQMMNDYGLIASNGDYGFGFQNSFNADKMGWVTDKYNKRIAALSNSEMDLLGDVLTSQIFQ